MVAFASPFLSAPRASIRSSATSATRPARRRTASHRHRAPITPLPVATPPSQSYISFPTPSIVAPSFRPPKPSHSQSLPHPLTLRAVNRRLKALAKRTNCLSTCLCLYDQLLKHHIQPDKYTYSLLLSACANVGATQQAMTLYQHIIRRQIAWDNHLRASFLTVIAKSKRPNIPLAIRVFSSSPTPSTPLCNILIHIFAATNNAQAANAVHRYMTGASIPPDAYTVSALIRAHVAAEGPFKALQVLRDMCKSGLTVHSSAFGQLISAFGRVGNVDEALALFDEMTVFGVAPTQNTFNILIAACEGRHVEKAFEIYQQMIATTSFKGDRYTYHALMKCALSVRDTTRVRQLYECIKRSQYQPNQVSYRMALEAAGMNMHVQLVEMVVHDVKCNQCVLRMDTMATLVAACIRCSDLQAAIAHFSAFVNGGGARGGEGERRFFEQIRRALTRFDCERVCDSAHTQRVVDQLERSWRREC